MVKLRACLLAGELEALGTNRRAVVQARTARGSGGAVGRVVGVAAGPVVLLLRTRGVRLRGGEAVVVWVLIARAAAASGVGLKTGAPAAAPAAPLPLLFFRPVPLSEQSSHTLRTHSAQPRHL